MKHYNIVKAPTKFDLVTRFFDARGCLQTKNYRALEFTVQENNHSDTHKIDIILTEISWEDGSGESWCFKGYCECSDVNTSQKQGSRVTGWFRTSCAIKGENIDGWIDID